MNKTTLKILIGGVVAVGLGAVALKIKDTYFDRVELEEVALVGLPCPDTSLVTPIAIEVRHASGFSAISYAGASASAPSYFYNVTLPEDERVSARVRIGTCRPNGGGAGGESWTCRDPQWIGGEQLVEVDTRVAKPELVVAVPGTLACRATADKLMVSPGAWGGA